jgi:hypothetical protein
MSPWKSDKVEVSNAYLKGLFRVDISCFLDLHSGMAVHDWMRGSGTQRNWVTPEG